MRINRFQSQLAEMGEAARHPTAIRSASCDLSVVHPEHSRIYESATPSMVPARIAFSWLHPEERGIRVCCAPAQALRYARPRYTGYASWWPAACATDPSASAAWCADLANATDGANPMHHASTARPSASSDQLEWPTSYAPTAYWVCIVSSGPSAALTLPWRCLPSWGRGLKSNSGPVYNAARRVYKFPR